MYFEPGMCLSVVPGMVVRSWEGSYFYLIRGREGRQGNPPPPTQLCRRDEALPRTIQFSPCCVWETKLLILLQINSFPSLLIQNTFTNTQQAFPPMGAPAHTREGSHCKAISKASFLHWCFIYQCRMQPYFATSSLFGVFPLLYTIQKKIMNILHPIEHLELWIFGMKRWIVFVWHGDNEIPTVNM